MPSTKPPSPADNTFNINHHTTRNLNRSDYKTMGLSSLGGTLEFYDFVIFIVFIKTLEKLFFPADMPQWLTELYALAIFAAGYLVRPLGGLVMAHFGDLIGRKHMFTLSIFLMAAPTLCIGLLPTYESIGYAATFTLLGMRLLQGFAIGGEMPGGWVFVGEHVPAKHYGLGLGVLTSGVAGGILLGSLVAIWLAHTYTETQIISYAWRIPFILGGVFGLISVYLRRYLSETPLFKEIAARRTANAELPIKTVLKEHLPACGLTALMTWSLSVAVVVVILMTPNLLQSPNYSIQKMDALQASCIATLVFVLGNILFGWMCDRLGSRLTMIISWGGLAISSYCFYSNLIGITQTELIVRYAVMALFAGSTCTMPIICVRAFPTAVRFTGLSFAYNMSYAVVGGFTPLLTKAWLMVVPIAPAYYIIFVSVLAMLLGCTNLARFGVDHRMRKES